MNNYPVIRGYKDPTSMNGMRWSFFWSVGHLCDFQLNDRVVACMCRIYCIYIRTYLASG